MVKEQNNFYVFGLRESARILDCEISNLRALQGHGIVVPSADSGKYNLEQLFLIRVILLIRESLGHRNLNFATTFGDTRDFLSWLRGYPKSNPLKKDCPLILFLDSGVVWFLDALSIPDEYDYNSLANQSVKEDVLDFTQEIVDGKRLKASKWLVKHGILSNNDNKIIVISLIPVLRYLKERFKKIGIEDKFWEAKNSSECFWWYKKDEDELLVMSYSSQKQMEMV